MASGKEGGFFHFRRSWVWGTQAEAKEWAKLDPYDYLTGGKLYSEETIFTTLGVARRTGWDPEELQELPRASSWISLDGKTVVRFLPKKE
jgi:hypothetical protein